MFHLVSGTGIQTHDFSNYRILPYPEDHGSRAREMFFPKRFKVFCLSKFQLSDPLEDKWSVLNWRKWLLFRRHRDKWERKKKRE